MTTPVLGITALLEQFDVFLVDQFGVLHNGRVPYPGAHDALQLLRRAEKRVVLVSNSAKRAAPNMERMRKLGFDDGLYDAFITSGEAAFRMMQGGILGLSAGRKTYVLAMDEDRSFMAGTGLVEVAEPDEADLLIIAGSQAPRVSLVDYRQRLMPMAASKVPALCLNPDKLMLTGNGMVFAPGAIADLYIELGGTVRWIGKPFRDIYEIALKAIGAKPGDRIMGCGDSIEHDVAGAKSIGASALLTLGGILKDASASEIEAEIARHEAKPDYIVPLFAP
jgi:HAD superfamily hydrolase (TIGR01459 family)